MSTWRSAEPDTCAAQYLSMPDKNEHTQIGWRAELRVVHLYKRAAPARSAPSPGAHSSNYGARRRKSSGKLGPAGVDQTEQPEPFSRQGLTGSVEPVRPVFYAMVLPHSGQKRDPAGTTAPQLGQVTCAGAASILEPQFGQNLTPAATSA